MAPGDQGDASYGTSAAPLQHRLRDRAAGIPTVSVFLEPRLNRKTSPHPRPHQAASHGDLTATDSRQAPTSTPRRAAIHLISITAFTSGR